MFIVGFKFLFVNIQCMLVLRSSVDDDITCDSLFLRARFFASPKLRKKLGHCILACRNCDLMFVLNCDLTVVFARLVQNWYSYQYTCLQVIEYIKAKQGFTGLLLTHIGTSAVMDLLLRLITCVEGTENKQNILTVSS